MRNCVYFTRIKPDPRGDGGARRVHQILQLLQPLGAELRVVQEQRRRHYVDYLVERVLGARCSRVWATPRRALRTRGEYFLWSRARRDYFWFLHAAAADCARTLRETGEAPALAFIDDPIYLRPLVAQLRRGGTPIVAVCHNIESLSRCQVAPDAQRRLLRRELELLARCDLVITISREETTLLHSLGIAALFHAYYPAAEVVEGLRQVRAARQDADRGGFLTLGSAANPATVDGMTGLIQAWHEQGLGRIAGALRVAGFGMDALRDDLGAAGQDVVFLGALDPRRLDEELVQARACLCHQTDGSGALTRITEMLIAGVPVVASAHAARSYHNQPGILEYSTGDELGRVLRRVAETPPVVPMPEKPDAAALLARITRHLGLPTNVGVGSTP